MTTKETSEFEEGFKSCNACRARRKRNSPKAYKRWKGSGLCVFCRVSKQREGYVSCEPCGERHNKKTLAYGKPVTRDLYIRKLKLAAFEAYGGCFCKCCGETIPSLLTIDHINNDGGSHRKEVGGGGSTMYRWLKHNNYPPGYQVLCWNCNSGKHYNRGYCPHQEMGVWQLTKNATQIIDSMLLKQLESNLREQSTYLHYVNCGLSKQSKFQVAEPGAKMRMLKEEKTKNEIQKEI